MNFWSVKKCSCLAVNGGTEKLSDFIKIIFISGPKMNKSFTVWDNLISVND